MMITIKINIGLILWLEFKSVDLNVEVAYGLDVWKILIRLFSEIRLGNCYQPGNIWVRTVKAKYLTNNKDNLFSFKKNYSASSAWESILDQGKLTNRGIKWTLGNSNNISFWYDICFTDYPLIDKLTP